MSKEKEKNWYFSFGCGHVPYNKNYVKIHGTHDDARAKMVSHFGKRWCFQYGNLSGANALDAKYHGLTELVIEDGKEYVTDKD